MPLPENAVFQRRNYLLAAAEGGFFMGGMAFLSMESVMPAMIHELNGPAWAVSLAPVLFYVGFGWPQIFSALWVERLRAMKPLILVFGTIQRLPYLAAGLFLIFYGHRHPMASVTIAFLTPFIGASLSGIQGSAYFELITRIVPVNRVASMWAIRNVMMACFGIGAGFLIKFILDTCPGVTGYGVLHLFTFVMMMVSLVLLAFIHETNIDHPTILPPLTLKVGIASFNSRRKENPSLMRFVISRMLFTSIFIAIPFLSLRAIEQTGAPASLVGILVLTQMIGFISGNILAGYLGDRMGTRIPMILGRVLLLATVVMAFIAVVKWHFMVVFLLLGVGLSTGQVGDMTMIFDFAPNVRRKFFFAVIAVLLVPGMLLSSAISAILQYREYGFELACLITLCAMGLSLYQLMYLKDPRHSH